jgi:hypothetical protein
VNWPAGVSPLASLRLIQRRGNVLDVEHRQGDGGHVVQPRQRARGSAGGTSTVVERVTAADLSGER